MNAALCAAAGIAVVALGGWVWYLQARWKRLETVLERWSRDWSAPPTVEEARRLGEPGRLLQKCTERMDLLSRQASNAQFDLRAILASMEDGVLVADREQRITFVNPALSHIFALKTEPIGETVLSTLRVPLLQTMVEGVLEDTVPQQAELEPVAVGREAHAQLVVSAAPLRDATGNPGVVMVFRDVARLRRLEEVRREFVANVSHELRTPLSIFHGYLENLIEDPDASPQEVRSSLLTMRKHALRLNALVEDLLTLARLESSRDALVPESVDLGDFLRETAEDWSGKASAKEVEIKVAVAEGLAEIWIDVLKFQQVLGNLLDNAIKYTPSGGTVTLRVEMVEEDENSWYELRVEDTGTGMSRDDLPHIFQRFYRADKARSRELGGTGLGLAIVKHIIQAHGGSVRAESQQGKGTQIILRLPAAPAA